MNMETVQLKNGSSIMGMLLGVYMMNIKQLFAQMSDADPRVAMPAGLGIYDLIQLCASDPEAGYTGDCISCSGANRKALLSLMIVEGGRQGPLRIRSEVKDLVQSALTYDKKTMGFKLQDPRKS